MVFRCNVISHESFFNEILVPAPTYSLISVPAEVVTATLAVHGTIFIEKAPYVSADLSSTRFVWIVYFGGLCSEQV